MADKMNDLIKKITKSYGEESLMLMGDVQQGDLEVSSTGSIILDDALGVGGYPLGRIVEIYGPEASGKTTVALHAIAQIQKDGGKAAFIDAENALDIEYAANIGVDVDNLLLSQPDSGEQALSILEQLVNSSLINIVVVDSVAALVPEVELMGEMSDQTIGAQARLMSKGLRKIVHGINKNNVIVIFINQLREKVGVIYGNPETTPGGRALKFYSSIRLEVRRSEYIKKDGVQTGIRSKVKVVKNKVAPPFKTVLLDINYGQGISKTAELVDLAVEQEVIKKSGAWYSYNDEKIAQGRDNVIQVLEDNLPLMEEIYHNYKKCVSKER